MLGSHTILDLSDLDGIVSTIEILQNNVDIHRKNVLFLFGRCVGCVGCVMLLYVLCALCYGVMVCMVECWMK